MCRFVLYLGPPLTVSSLVTEPEHSLINQSINALEREEPLNGDGFGVAWYAHEIVEEPGLFRSITPAWNNANLQRLARVTRSGCILAHVRAATQGLSVAEHNCHPFVRGRLAFMHNGDLGGFRHVRRTIVNGLSERAYLSIQGSTDSEHLFALIHEAMEASRTDDPCDRLAQSLIDGVERALSIVRKSGIDEHSYLNMALTDGVNAVACRFTTDLPDGADSLYVHTGRKYVCDGGLCRMVEPEAGKGAAIVSSEPLSADPGWMRVPVNHVVRIDAMHRVDIRPWPSTSRHDETVAAL